VARAGGVTRPSGMSAVARPVQVPRGVQRPTGQKRYRVNIQPTQLTGWAVQPYGGFTLSGNNSFEEWPVFWALMQELGPPDQGTWTYQIKIGAQQPGGSKPDFLIYYQPPIIIRVQSDRYHLTVNSWRQAGDREQRIVLERQGYAVIDVFPQHYMNDDTHAVAVLSVVREALNYRQRTDPLTTATSVARG